MTKLLVSIRSAEEAWIAMAAGVDLIDIKEPRRGALGAADPSVWRSVQSAVAGRVPISCALGELSDPPPAMGRRIPPGMGYCKVGLAGMAETTDWEDTWRVTLAGRPPGCQAVAVVYADYQSARAPSPPQVLAALRRSCAAVLVDTFDKAAGDVFAHWPGGRIGEFLDEIRSAGLISVLGGGLSWKSLDAALDLGPDYLAVRGLACGGDRGASLNLLACQRLAAAVRDAAALGKN